MLTTGITNKVAAIPDCSDPPMYPNYNNRNVFMYSPAISLASDTGVWLKYDSYFLKDSSGTHIEQATVEISTDTGKTWTIVQEVPANTSSGYFTTWYINLSAYNNTPTIWIGFRYNDSGGYMKGWAIDNVQVFVPSHKDMSFKYIKPTDSLLSYVVMNNGYIHQGQVFNAGIDTVNSFSIKYLQGSNVWTDNISGVKIPPFSTYDITFTKPDTVSTPGSNKIIAWVDLPGDNNHNNDTAKTTLRAAYFMPKKLVAIEDGTSTKNGFSPKGWVYMNNLPGDFDACQISVHDDDSDGMALPYYANYLYFLRWANTPYTLIDRKKIPQDSFFSILNIAKNYFGFADIILNPVLNGDSLTVSVSVTPAVDLYGDFRLVLVITEDHVTGTTDSFDQRNYYSGGYLGAMSGFESKPIEVPAAEMYYNFVARSARPSPIGMLGMLPTTMLHNITYNYTLGSKIEPYWQHDKLKAIVLLIRNDDSTVLNSNKTYWPLYVSNTKPLSLYAGIYPNPSYETTNLYVNVAQTETIHFEVSDLSGRTLYVHDDILAQGANKFAIPVSNLSTGMYILNITTNQGRKTLKLDVVH